MNKDDILHDLISDVQDELAYLEEARTAFRLVFDHIESEGMQRKGKIDNQRAMAFVNILPEYMATVNVIWRDLHDRLKEVSEITEKAFDAYKIEKQA